MTEDMAFQLSKHQLNKIRWTEILENLTPPELNQLRNEIGSQISTKIIIVPTDKGNIIAVMDKQVYKKSGKQSLRVIKSSKQPTENPKEQRSLQYIDSWYNITAIYILYDFSKHEQSFYSEMSWLSTLFA